MQDKINTLDRVSGWVANCDTKSSIMMALIGVFISMIFTSDFLLNEIQKIVAPILTYWKTGIGSFDWFTALTLLMFLGMVFCLLYSLFNLINSLAAKTCSKQTGDNHVRTHSLIHYGSIQKLSYNKFKESVLAETDDERLDDVLSQIYINSKRCQEKFDYYNIAIRFIKLSVVLFVIFVIFLIL